VFVLLIIIIIISSSSSSSSNIVGMVSVLIYRVRHKSVNTPYPTNGLLYAPGSPFVGLRGVKRLMPQRGVNRLMPHSVQTI
jgi:hypothetical protein